MSFWFSIRQDKESLHRYFFVTMNNFHKLYRISNLRLSDKVGNLNFLRLFLLEVIFLLSHLCLRVCVCVCVWLGRTGENQSWKGDTPVLY